MDTTQGFTIVRQYDAAPEQVWQAWTDPDQAALWWHPRGLRIPRESVILDVRVGGRYTYTMVREDTGEEFVTAGVYREVVPCERLVFTWGEADDDPEDAPVVALTLEPADGGTRLTFELRGVQGSPGDDYVYDGWDQALEILAELLHDNPRGGTLRG
ncbi:SRPBCC family protein [Kocuria coralli]|nr:SRPBCC domain-containing protein [Kocuria coralli]